MSERMLRAQVAQFHHRKERALAESLTRQHLFSDRPEVLTTVFRCEPVGEEASLAIGNLVILLPDAGALRAVYENAEVGRINGEGAVQLLEALSADSRASEMGMVVAEVVQTPALSGFFEVRVCKVASSSNEKGPPRGGASGQRSKAESKTTKCDQGGEQRGEQKPTSATIHTDGDG